MSPSRRILPALGALLSTWGLAHQARAADVAATSCEAADVLAAVAQAVDGDTVTVPPCAASLNVTWDSETSPVIISEKGITLQGSGIDVTNVTLTGNQAFGMTASTANVRFTGFTFTGKDTTGQGYSYVSTGDAGTARVDHNRFISVPPTTTSGNQFPLIVWSGHAVVDHNSFEGQGATVANTGNEITKRRRAMGWGENWSSGTVDWVFLEDNTFTLPCDGSTQPVDMAFGAPKVVFRHNVVNGGQYTAHGACWSAAASTGHIASDIYDNEFRIPDGCTWPGAVTDIMGGTLLFHGNVVKNLGSGRYSVDSCATETTTCPHNFQDVRTLDTTHACNGGNTLWMYCDATPDKWCAGSDDEHWYTCHTDADCAAFPPTFGPPLGNCTKMRCSKTWVLCSQDSDCPSSETCSNYLDMQMGTPDTGYRCFNGTGTGQLLDADGSIALDPMYGWNNTLETCAPDGTGCQYAKEVLLATADISVNTKLNRDFYNTPKPGYCPFTYPHPLTGLAPQADPGAPGCGPKDDAGAPLPDAGTPPEDDAGAPPPAGGGGRGAPDAGAGASGSGSKSGCSCSTGETEQPGLGSVGSLFLIAAAGVSWRRRGTAQRRGASI